ncbi:MAG: 2Fe-2S iron-sulfur cluster-binding protein [Alphaproteobacteria bacterium]
MPKVTFINPEGEKTTVEAPAGWSLLDIAHENDIDIEGVCGGGMACSTCHVYVEKKFFNKIPGIGEEEEAILEFAVDRKKNSRLGCQIKLEKFLDGLEVTLPKNIESLF